MWSSRKIIRWAITGVVAIAVPGVIYPVVSEFFIELAREWGWYETPSAKVAAMTGWLSVAQQTWVYVGTAALTGLAAGLWLDSFLRRREVRVAKKESDDGTALYVKVGSDGCVRRSEFKEKVIDIEKHVTASGHLLDTIYDRCRIVGPAVLMFEEDCVIDDILLTDAESHDIAFIPLQTHEYYGGVVKVRRCIIRKCELTMITIADTPERLELLRDRITVIPPDDREDPISRWRSERLHSPST